MLHCLGTFRQNIIDVGVGKLLNIIVSLHIFEKHGNGAFLEHIVNVGFLHVFHVAHHHFVERQLLIGTFEHALLVAVARDQSIHIHLFRLADAMATRNRLHIVHRVPVRVVNDHRVGRHQVDADAACSRGQQKTKNRVIFLEAINSFLSLDARDTAVQTLIQVVSEVEIVLEYIQQVRHLAEDEHTMSFALQLWQQLVEQHQFARRLNEIRVHGDIVSAERRHGLLHVSNQKRMIAALAQLHGHIHQTRFGRATRTQLFVRLLIQSFVPSLLKQRQLHPNNLFFASTQVSLHEILETLQQSAFQQLLQLVLGLGQVFELFAKRRLIRKLLGVHKMQ
mmetsp:Transcript_35108/g.57362  ORF Transcript_35108/g.57362 Transcript_35108/m.57362 type:complete len:336 (+) Transcript_35108:400-1407(+)